MPVRNRYYHVNCYNTWKAAPTTEKDFHDMIYDFLSCELKVSYDYFLCEAQIKKFWKEKKINQKGIFYTLKYFYGIKGNPWDKGHGGLGIVPYVIDEAREYWIGQERTKRGFLKALEEQQKEKMIVRIVRKEPKKIKYDLNKIGGEE